MKLATLCYVKQNRHTLMIHRVKKENDMHAGKWNGLGGKLNAGETPEECVVREVREESGLVIRNPRLHGILTFPAFANDEDWYAFLFTATEFEGELIESNEGILKWVPDRELLDLNLWEGDKIFIPWLAKEDFFSGKFKYRDGVFEGYEVIFYGGE